MNFLKLTVISNTAIVASMPTSISTSETSTPSIISLRTAWIYQRAGSTAEMACKITGILSMGNIMPESNMVGIISSSPDTSMAATCVRVTVEISSRQGDKNE